MALLVGELFARITSDSSGYRRDMEKVDAQGASSAKLAEKHALQITQARKAELDATGKVRVAMAALEELQAKGNVSATKMAAAQERLAAAKRALATATERVTVTQNAAVAAQQKATAKAAELAAKEEEAGRQIEFADRHAGRFTATLLGMAVAGGGAGAAITGGLAAVPVLLALIAAKALSARDDVSDAWTALGSEASDTIERIAAPLSDELVTAAGQATVGLRRITPELKAMAEEGGPSVTMLVDGFVRLAVNAMPGARRAAAESQATFAGLNAMLDRTGTGLSDFFEETAEAAPAAGRAAGDAGRLIEDLLGSLGSLAADLAQQGAGPWSQFVGVVDQTTDATVGLGENGLPLVASAASNLLSVVSRVLDVLGPLAPLLGTIGGILLSYKAGAAIVGVAGDALGRLGGRLETTTVGSSRTTGAVRGLGSALGVIGPYGAIAAGGLLAVDAAATAAFGSTDQLAQGLMAGGNAADQATKKLGANTVAVNAAKTAGGDMAGVLADLLIPTMRDAEKTVSDQRASMTTLQRAQIDAAAAAADHSLAVEKYGPTSSRAIAASALLTQAQDALKRAQAQAADATKTLTDRLIEQQALALGLANDNLRLRIATTNYEQAQKSLNDTLKTGTASELEIKAAKEGVESAALSVIQASGLEAAAHYANKDSVEAQTSALNAQNAKALELAASMTGPLPLALATVIANMDDAALSALGATREIDGTNTAVITLKDSKTIKIDANDQATPVIHDIQNKINAMKGTSLDIHIRQLVSTTGPPLADLGNPAAVLPPPRAGGGDVRGGHAYQINEHGQELFAPGMDGAIIPATQTRHLMTLLDAMSDRGAPALAAATNGRSTTVYVTMQAVKSLPTAQQLRDVLHDVDVIYDDE